MKIQSTSHGRRLSFTFALALCLAGSLSPAFAAVGPKYHRPEVASPPAYTDAETPGNLGSWKQATPSDGSPRGEWWKVFKDPALDALQSKAAQFNQDLRAALARVEQARAGARQAKADYYPNLSLDPNYARTRYSPNAGLAFPVTEVGNIKVPLDLTYEIDFWGRVRRGFEAATRDSEARAAAFETLRLALHSEVAQNYFSLRALDAERRTLNGTADLRREALALIKAKANAGTASELEVARAETELASIAAEVVGLERRRSELKNAIAVLVGEAATSFQLPDQPIGSVDLPAIPAGLPSELLERRPDISEAERTLAASNARIGVAKAAFFPTVRITSLGGFESADVDTLFDWQSRTWSIGPSITLPIFQGGRNRANLRRAQATFEEGVANYRQRVLVAFKEVQDALTASRLLRDQADAQAKAVAAAQKTAKLSRARYDAGFVSYLEVVESERTALAVERGAAQIAGQRYVTSVQLIKALGGGWSQTQLPPMASR